MNLFKLIERHEGVRYNMYKDSLGIATIGIGHNLEAKPISEAAVQQIFNDDVADVQHEVQFAFDWFHTLNDARQAVVLDMVFNMGMSRFKGFKRAINHMSAGTYSAASIEMLDSKWAEQVGSRADDLAEMMRSGQWPDA